MELKRQLGLFTAIIIIIANMIGTGIFMTTGNALGVTSHAGVVLALWILGGLIALTGSLCYAELASMWPQDGGEYVYLRKIFGQLPSFLTGWISLTVGFTASVAITALTLVWYFSSAVNIGFLQDSTPCLCCIQWCDSCLIWYFPDVVNVGFLQNSITQKFLAASLIFIFGLIHILGVKIGGFVQNAITLIKIVIVLSLVIFGLYYADWSQISRLTASYKEGASFLSTSSSFALLMIMFAYSGWNSATYIAGEIKDPAKNLVRAMFWGTLSVIIVYLLLNIVFLISSPGSEIMGSNTIGSIAVKNLFGTQVASFFSTAIALVLLSSVSVQMMIGPRVYYAMAKDGAIFSSLARINEKYKTPDLAIWLQTFIAIVYIFIGENHISNLLKYMGFSLSIFPLLAVIGMVYMRIKEPNLPRPYKVKAYPIVAGINICLTSIMLITALIVWTKTSLFAIGVLLAGAIIYFFWKKVIK